MKLASKAFHHCFQKNGSRGGSHYFSKLKMRKIHFNEAALSFTPCPSSVWLLPFHLITFLC